MNKIVSAEARQENTIDLMLKVLDFSKQTELEIRWIIEDIGIENFLINIDALDISNEIKEKVNALKNIIDEVGDNCDK